MSTKKLHLTYAVIYGNIISERRKGWYRCKNYILDSDDYFSAFIAHKQPERGVYALFLLMIFTEQGAYALF